MRTAPEPSSWPPPPPRDSRTPPSPSRASNHLPRRRRRRRRLPHPPPKPYHASPLPRSNPHQRRRRVAGFLLRHRLSGGDVPPEPPQDDGDGEGPSFDLAVGLFNGGDYYGCHDALEELWYGAEDPIRTLLHGVLQCAVGLHHLFNQNHRGAMMELGEGLCKLRKMGFDGGPFLRFEEEVSAVLEFVYQTQKELAAYLLFCTCAGTEELCLAMDGSERSYQLLGSFAAGQQLYHRISMKMELPT
uniref:DUF309 domain-containing protein n=1 Tax=Ananas comosus var. bracteatus TaxID=296719 RepID=A0A6V7NFM8_ANACO|nr:unnamed protein product [Ananas comosus var. bracteatus]